MVNQVLCNDCRQSCRILDHNREQVTKATLWKQNRLFPSFQERKDCPLCRLVARTLEEHLPTLSANIEPHARDSDVLVIHSPEDTGILQWHNSSAEDPFTLCQIEICLETSWRPPNTLDSKAIKEWVEKCELRVESHESALPPQPFTDIILIDVRQCNLIPATTAYRYAALSYVWGGVKMVSTVSKNYSKLLQPGALTSERIPQTIQDAMDFTRSIGVQYLWVDTLCIIQDDNQHKYSQLVAMHRIYSQSLVTVVAVSGSDANAGLCGVRKGSRINIIEQATLDHGQDRLSISLSARPPQLEDVLRLSIYNSRCWTYQEHLLSQRCLFFTKWQVFLHCQHEVAREDGCTDIEGHKLVEKVNPFRKILVRDGKEVSSSKALECYRSLVRDISSRHLTYPSDILNAFSGLTEYFRSFVKDDFLSGVLVSSFDYALLWFPTDFRPMQQSRRAWTFKEYFPSWSWAGWIGAVRFPSQAQQASLISLIGNIEIGWPVPRRTLVLLESPAAARSLSETTKEQSHLPVGDFESCILQFEAESVFSSAFRCSVAPGFSPLESVSLHAREQEYPREDWDKCGTLRFNLKGAGFLWNNWEEELPQGYLIALSATSYRTTGAYWETYLRQSMINVMMIEEKDHFAERIAIGQVEANTWNALPSQRRQIRLR